MKQDLHDFMIAPQKTSFGRIQRRIGSDVEYLEFDRKGRPHTHPVYEFFVTLSEFGQISIGETVVETRKGDLTIIPPHTEHWMHPRGEQTMKGILWYEHSNEK